MLPTCTDKPIYLKDVIDFEAISQALASQLKTLSLETVIKEFQDWFWDIQDCDYWFYSSDQAAEHIEFLKQRFLEEYYIFPHKIASELGLDVLEA